MSLHAFTLEMENGVLKAQLQQMRQLLDQSSIREVAAKRAAEDWKQGYYRAWGQFQMAGAEADLARAEADRLHQELTEEQQHTATLEEELEATRIYAARSDSLAEFRKDEVRNLNQVLAERNQEILLATAEATALYERLQDGVVYVEVYKGDHAYTRKVLPGDRFVHICGGSLAEDEADLARAEADRLYERAVEAETKLLSARMQDNLAYRAVAAAARDQDQRRIADLEAQLRTETHKRVQAEGQAISVGIQMQKAVNEAAQLRVERDATRKSPPPVTVRFNGETWYGEPGDEFWINYDGPSNVALYRNMQVLDQHIAERHIPINTTPTPTHNYLVFDSDDADGTDDGIDTLLITIVLGLMVVMFALGFATGFIS